MNPAAPDPRLTSDDPAGIPPVETATVPPRDAKATVSPQPCDTNDSTSSWPTISGYEILAELGRGGMGVVYHARQVSLNRSVAIKMVLSGQASASERKCFLAEAEAVAALTHPGIVQVFDFGAVGDQPYFSLEICPGGSLAAKLAGTPLPPREAARIVEQIARAVQHAHDKGIVHRDLKPGNVLFAADGSPKVTDFGLAKRVESESGLTQTGAILGTPSYMAPEQAGGEKKSVGPAADVYALGAILYECLTGRPPFRAATPLDTVLQVISEEPAPARRLNPQAPADLETIAHKCLQKEPAKRYASAKALADDLARWQHGEPIAARPVGRVERALKWAKRRPAFAALAGVSILAAAALIGGGLYFNAQLIGKEQVLSRQQNDLSNMETDLGAERLNIRRLNGDARLNVARSNLILAESTWKDHDALGTLKALNQVPADLRQWEWGYQQRRALSSYATLWGHAGQVTSVAFSPDGARLASGSYDNTVRLWDAKTGALEQTLSGHSGSVNSMAFSPDGARLASGSGDNTVRLWDAKTGAVIQTLARHTDMVMSLAFSPDGARLASGSFDKTVRHWDAKTGVVIQTLAGHTSGVASLAFSPDGARLASGSGDNTVRLWDAKTGAAIQTLAGHTNNVTSVAFSPDGARLASRDRDNKVKVWDLESGKEVADPRGEQWLEKPTTSSRSPDGQWYACPASDGTILLVKPLPPDEYELGYRAWFARPDPDWHWQQAQKFEKDQSWFAARFHLDQLLKLEPDNAEYRKRREHADAEWKKAHLATGQ